MKIGDKVITKRGNIGTIAYKVDCTTTLEDRWCVHFLDNTIGDFNESELELY